MPGNADPSVWQQILDSRLVQGLAFGFSVAIAFGMAIGRAVKRIPPVTREDAELKARLEKGIWEQVAHDIHEIRKEQTKLGERVARIEGFLEER